MGKFSTQNHFWECQFWLEEFRRRKFRAILEIELKQVKNLLHKSLIVCRLKSISPFDGPFLEVNGIIESEEMKQPEVQLWVTGNDSSFIPWTRVFHIA
jgi:hypothetical protein